MNPLESCHLLAGWLGVAFGIFSGGAIGLLFHREQWLGGYGSWPRRMIRLGHISFFGLAFLNFMYALTVHDVSLQTAPARLSSILFLAGAVTMPLVCFLTAWKKPLRQLFPVPVTCITGALILLFFAWF